MSDSNLFIVTAAETVTGDDNARPFQGRRAFDRAAQASQVAIETVKDNMGQFLADMGEILGASEQLDASLQVSKVEVTAQVTAQGQVALLGSGGGASGTLGIKFTFEKA